MGGSACWPMLLLHLHKQEAWPADNHTEEEVVEAEGPTPRAAGGERALPEQRLQRAVRGSAEGTDTIHSPQGYPAPHCNTCSAEGKTALRVLLPFLMVPSTFCPFQLGSTAWCEEELGASASNQGTSSHTVLLVPAQPVPRQAAPGKPSSGVGRGGELPAHPR